MLRESLKDASQIIQNILTQSLDVKNSSENISLLEAARSYISTKGQSEDLSLVLQALLRYRDPTQTLLNELTIISNELRSFHR